MRGYSQPYGVTQVGHANMVAGVFGDVRGGEATAEANARLIAAAPELAEALSEAAGRYKGTLDALLAVGKIDAPFYAEKVALCEKCRALLARIDGEQP